MKNTAFVLISYFSKYDCFNPSLTFLLKNWGYICFTMLCQFLLYNKMNQPYVYICICVYPLPLEPLSNIAYTTAPHLGHHRAPS